ncbi:cilia- and flagella-associated protein 97 isoform X1 [Thunnus albacares]|uniref:cilia- and flagella-associated protein 97 isoform X1 n=1 Tax=Thunnus albacares TaxID=8236 RepID=UPI001CF6770B|nr:cilia- and flagella-associated protein 97 isoform X1 [Thunnus albacares]
MFNPSELEGEVDHSFFDSDCDDSQVSRDGRKKIDGNLKTEKETPLARERLHANTAGGLSPRTDRAKKHLKRVEDNSSSGAERKENSRQSKEEVRSRTSSISSVASASHKVNNNSNDGKEDSKKSSGTFMALLAEARVVDDEDVIEEEVLSSNPKCSGSKGRNKRSPTQCRRSPSPTSSEISTDTDSVRSCSSLEPPRPSKPSLSRGMRRTRVGSVRSRNLPPLCTEQSDGTVTDVSPLSSPDISPLQSLDLNRTEGEDGSLKEQQQASVPSTGLSNIHRDDSDPDVDECSLSSGSQLGGKVVYSYPGGRNRKNYSFTNDEVRRIDRENQRLLRELSRISPTSRPGSAAGRKSYTAKKNLPVVLRSHSALKRQKEQQRIERDNLAFLKRLESAKPSPGLKRSEQLADYHRLVGYPGAAQSSIYTSTTNKEMSTSKERTTSKGIKRQREQQRIERDNLAFLKRLESAKPSPGLKRSEQLADYHRLVAYPGAPQSPIYTVSTTNKERSTSKERSTNRKASAGKCPRPASAAHHSTRAVSITSDSSSTPVPRLKKLSTARPAWC